VDDCSGPRGQAHLSQVTEKPETGDVGRRRSPIGEQSGTGDIVEGGHRGDRLSGKMRRAFLTLDGRGDDPDPERLGEDQSITGPGS